jgi:hypothetical protein
MANVVRAGSATLASSHRHLKQIIAAYLADPTLDRKARQSIVEQQFGRIDGGSSRRLVKEVLALTLKRRSAGDPNPRCGRKSDGRDEC